MEKLNFFEKVFHNKNVIKGIFIFPLISIVFIALALKDFVDVHYRLAYIGDVRRLFIMILVLLSINMLANFSALILYYCLSNRVDNFTKKYGNKKAL